MIYRFTLISDEADQFRREYQIDPDATFYDFYKVILNSIAYEEAEHASFFICDEDWEPKEEINLIEQDNNPEHDCWVMNQTHLTEFIEDEEQRLVLQFDNSQDRFFSIELTEIITGKNIDQAKCTQKIGEAPVQHIHEEVITQKNDKSIDMDETFYGDQDYDSLEIEGFEDLKEL